jgi:hypothetical protein
MERLILMCLELGIEVSFGKDLVPYCIEVKFTKRCDGYYLWVTRLVDRTQLDRMRSPESYWDALVSNVLKEFAHIEPQPTEAKSE